MLTRTDYSLEDVGGTLSWGSLRSFIKNIGTDSALAKELGKSTGWEDTLTTNQILADIFDILQVIAILISRKRKRITPYPRPGADKNNRKIGKDALPFNDLREWFRRKREKHGKR